MDALIKDIHGRLSKGIQREVFEEISEANLEDF